MKTREYQDLKKKDSADLHELLQEKRSELVNLRFSHATGALENPARLAEVKREIAQVLTLINEKRAEVKAEA